MISEQDRTFAALAQGNALLEDDQLQLCLKEGVVSLVTCASPEVEGRVREEVHRVVAIELAHRHAVEPVLRDLARSGIEAVVLKGSALAYAVYEKPWQRLRNDTDLLVRGADRERVAGVLAQHGFSLKLPAIGTVAHGEESYYLEDGEGNRQCIDLHWRFNNHWQLARQVVMEDVWASRLPVPGLCQGAWRCSNLWALIVACLHRVPHRQYVAYQSGQFVRYESDFTLWTYDIHLLARMLEEKEWDELVAVALQRGIASMVLDGLQRSIDLFDSPVPERVVSLLSVTRGQLGLNELTGWRNFMAVPWHLKPLYIWQRIFPSRAHMDARYGVDKSIAVRHVSRWLAGIQRRLPALVA